MIDESRRSERRPGFWFFNLVMYREEREVQRLSCVCMGERGLIFSRAPKRGNKAEAQRAPTALEELHCANLLEIDVHS